jgi:hypothetical protein
MITGAYRSGTTLVEKSLSGHPSAAIFSQPFPFLYFDTKRRFLASFGIDDRYPLGSRFRDVRYTTDDFVSYLTDQPVTAAHIAESVDRMRGYSGFWTPELLDVIDQLGEGSLHQIQRNMYGALAERFAKSGVSLVGSKEILVEEYVPYLIQQDARIIIVIRDPRSMIASICYGRGAEWVGGHRPILFHLRNWRKSAAYALAFESDVRVHTVGFESLVTNPLQALGMAAEFLELDPTGFGEPSAAILDQRGQVWNANSSFDSTETVVDRWKGVLDDQTVEYIEMCTLPELLAFGYEPSVASTFDVDALAAFQEPFQIRHADFPPGYSTAVHNLADEQRRFDLVQDASLSDAVADEWYLFPTTHEKLLQAFQARADH